MYRRYIGKMVKVTQFFSSEKGTIFFFFNGKLISSKDNEIVIIDQKTRMPKSFNILTVANVDELDEKEKIKVYNKFDSYWTWADKIDNMIAQDIRKTNENILKGFEIKKGGENNAKEETKGKAKG